MQQPESLETIFRRNPDVKAYWGEVIANRQQHGESEKPACDVCGGEGYLLYRYVKNGELVRKEFGPCSAPGCPALAARQDARYGKLCNLAQIPPEYLTDDISFAGWEALLADYPDFAHGKRDAYGAALAFFAARDAGYRFTLDDAAAAAGLPTPEQDSPPRCSIVYTGTWGVGKTSLACAVAKALLDDGKAVVYVLMSEFLQALYERMKDKTVYEFGGDAEDIAELIRTYQQAPVLIIDEFSLPGSEWQRTQVYALINYRYTFQLPTLITTNHSADLLADERRGWGMAIGSRLQAMAHWFRMGGLELRRRDAEVESR